MDVLFVYRGLHLLRQGLDLETTSAVVQAAGHRTACVYDPNVLGLTDNVLQLPRVARWISPPGTVAKRILSARPGIVIFCVVPNTYQWARDLAREVKASLPVPIVFMGLHPTLRPEHVMEDPFVDFVIQGEAENSLPKLLRALEQGAPVTGAGNLWHRHNGRVLFTFQETMADLDALPLPDKDLFHPYVSYKYSYATTISRGCPFGCTFCEESCMQDLFGGRFFRRKRVATILQELTWAQDKFGFREVIFKDSYLSGDGPWLEELLAAYRARIAKPFKCFCTVTGFTENTARRLKESGCYCVEFGLQTWNDRIRREVLGRRETAAAALQAFDLCARHHLWYDVDHMFHLPGETEADHIQGARMYAGLRHLNRVKVHHLVYLPTAAIVEHGIKTHDLTAEAPARLSEGWEGSFYTQASGDPEKLRLVRSYSALYKLLPGMSPKNVEWWLRGSRIRALGRIPGFLLALLQGCLALRSGDLRFAAYLREYPARAWRSLLTRRAAPPAYRGPNPTPAQGPEKP